MKADNAPDRFHPDSRALVKSHLPPEVFNCLAHMKTGTGFTLEQAIQSGVKNSDSSIGIYAGDPESYRCFDLVFSPIIREYHNLNPEQGHHPEFRPVAFPMPDPEKKYILSTRIRVARNIAPFPFPPNMNEDQRRGVEKRAVQAMEFLPSDLTGTYISFNDLAQTQYLKLLEKKLVFPLGDRFQEAAGINQDFPTGRGVFLSRDKGFRIWVNEEDHLRIMALSGNSDLSEVFNRLILGLDALGRHMDFSHDPTLGFLSSCPTNIGTAMRAGVHIRLMKLEQRPTLLKELVSRHHLQIRGTQGEKTTVDQGIFDISNARRLGVSANEIVQDLHTGLKAIIHTEKNL